MRPIEWDVLHPLNGQPLVIVRLVYLGPRRGPYYRAVSANPDRALRKLVGYWGTLEDAHTGCFALYEQATGESIAGGNRHRGRSRRRHRRCLASPHGQNVTQRGRESSAAPTPDLTPCRCSG